MIDTIFLVYKALYMKFRIYYCRPLASLLFFIARLHMRYEAHRVKRLLDEGRR